jgi:2-methylisocitrate lyase-like PEP mutase family enzyme
MRPTLAPDKHETAAMRLRRTLESGRGLTVCPGVYDGLSARIALDVGFDALYMVCPFACQQLSEQ